jgi:cyclophilin family peptidyl-prolyl cis-trans isomerase
MKSSVLRFGCALIAAALFPFASALAQNTMVRMETTMGILDMKLLDAEAPVTVANFLAYERAGAYNNGLVHRSAWSSPTIPFVIQAGGWYWPSGGFNTAVTTNPPIANEFSASRSNLLGTVAMAKLANNPDSATSQWFVNLADNTFLDSQNGGFTVFARVTSIAMVTANRISLLPVANACAPNPPSQCAFGQLPVLNANNPSNRSNVVLINAAYELPSGTDSDRIFNYLEAAYPQFVSPLRASWAGTALGYYARWYAGSNAYVGTQNGNVYYYLPAVDPDIHLLGSIDAWLATAQAAGY